MANNGTATALERPVDGPLPERCECGKQIPADLAERARKAKLLRVVRCKDCGKGYRVEEVKQPELPAQPRAGYSIFSATVIYRLEIRRPSFKVQVNRYAVEVKSLLGSKDPDQKRTRVHKLTVDPKECRELAAVIRAENRIRDAVISRSLPTGGFLDGGHYLVLDTDLEEIDARVETLIAEEYLPAVQGFLAVRDAVVERAKETLGDVFRASDIPAVQELRRAFGVSHRPIEVRTPEGKLSDDMRAKALAREAEDRDGMMREVQQGLRGMLLTFVTQLANKLGRGEDGEKKRFYDTDLTRLTSFLSDVDKMNVTGDTELSVLAAKARGILQGVNPDDLRKDGSKGVQQQVEAGIQRVKSSLEEMGVVPVRRKFLAGDDD